MLRYHVSDMSCGHCVQAITEAVKGVDPSAEVTVDLAAKRVDVSGALSGEAAAAAIRDAGYTPLAAGAGAGPAKAGCCGSC
ncbi:heavy-metal-associated domain-containing protein [Phenylobacterium zucineum]|nr:heavy-metal-associated domain-containing protein [Phenylobacterium zucineum]